MTLAVDLGVELSTPTILDSNDNESVDEELDNGVSPRESVLPVIGETWFSSESVKSYKT